MPMIEYFQEAQGLSNNGAPRGLPPIFKTVPSEGSRTGEPGITGALVASDRQTAAPQSAPSGIRIAGNLQAAKLLRGQLPTYPELAKKSGIEGNVRLEALINRDGTIKGLTTISGHPLLVPAALDAVKQWVYQPTLLNGTPVEVVTEIIVSFPPK
jgi:protein TonB